MAMTYSEDGSIKKRKGSKVAMDISPKNLKNLMKTLKMDPFTGGNQIDDIIKEQRKTKKNMKGKA